MNFPFFREGHDIFKEGYIYSKGLTQEQVGDVFNDIYGEHYSKASISRMLDYLRKDVQE